MTPSAAMTCPRCGAIAAAAPSVQACAQCQGKFTLRAGPRIDPAAVPPPYDPRLARIVVKSAGVVIMRRAVLETQGICEGALDPITGLIPFDQQGVAYPDIVTVAVWRRIDVLRLVVSLLIPVPLTLLFGYLAVAWRAPGLLAGAMPFGAVAAFLLYDSLAVKAHMVRVVGSARVLTVRFDSPMWRRQKFHDELLRRAGIPASVIP